jgi:hypothetical protein
MSKLIISEIERKHISSLHNLFLLEQTVEKVKVFKDKGGTYQYSKLPNGTYWYKAGNGPWTQQTNQKGMEAIEKRITSPDLIDAQPDLEVTSIDTNYKVEVKDDNLETTGTTTATTGTTINTKTDDKGEDEGEEEGEDKGEGEGEEEGDGEDDISAVKGKEDAPPVYNQEMQKKYPKNPLAKYSGYFKKIKII